MSTDQIISTELPPNIKAAIYHAGFSTENIQREFIEAQLAAIERFCERIEEKATEIAKSDGYRKPMGDHYESALDAVEAELKELQ